MASRGAYSHVICYFVDGRAKAKARANFFSLNGIIHFLIHRSALQKILYKKLSSYLCQKVTSFIDVSTFTLRNLSYERRKAPLSCLFSTNN